jgi:hypothetical protein
LSGVRERGSRWRTDVWQHRAASAYKNYVSRRPDDRTGWIEWARRESWRGNDAGALSILNRMENGSVSMSTTLPWRPPRTASPSSTIYATYRRLRPRAA